MRYMPSSWHCSFGISTRWSSRKDIPKLMPLAKDRSLQGPPITQPSFERFCSPSRTWMTRNGRRWRTFVKPRQPQIFQIAKTRVADRPRPTDSWKIAKLIAKLQSTEDPPQSKARKPDWHLVAEHGKTIAADVESTAACLVQSWAIPTAMAPSKRNKYGMAN